MRILHTADWHLGKLFHGLHLTNDQALLFEREFLPLVRDIQPDLVLVAGDVFDRPVPPAEAVALLSEILTRLYELKTRVVLLPGNHDSRERLAFARELLSRLEIFVAGDGSQIFNPLTLSFAGTSLNLFLVPYLSSLELREILKERDLLPEEVERPSELWSVLLKALPRRRGINLLVAHLFVEGGRTSDSETTLWVGGEQALPVSLFRNFELVLLGHLHRHQSPAENIIYAGSLLPLSFSEVNQTKGVVFIEVDLQKLPRQEFFPLTPPREFLVLEDYFENLERHPRTEAYVKIVLRDKLPIPEVFERLRKVFPYLLALETPYLKGQEGLLLHPSWPSRFKAQELFSAFLQEVAGRPPSPEEEDLFEELLSSMAPI